jgi:small-conductance mechanosensitive channel
MNHDWDWTNVQSIIFVAGAFVAAFLLLFTTKKLILRRVMKWAERDKPHWYSVLIGEIQFPLNIIILTIALGIALQAGPESLRNQPVLKAGSQILLILAIFWLIDRALTVAIKYGGFSAKLTATTKTLFLTFTRIVVVVLSVMIVLDTLGISITPLLASLGIGSVAIALALQDTLGNFFSGVYVLVDKPIRVGDTVGMEDGTVGVVRRIGWRSSHIEVQASNTLVIPNSKLANSVVTNYDLPTSETNVTLPIGVAYESDLEFVEKVTIEIARSLIESHPALVRGFEPIVRYTQLADSSINFNLTLRVRNFGDINDCRHLLIKKIHARYKTEGIDIPYPQRTVRLFHNEQKSASTDARI